MNKLRYRKIFSKHLGMLIAVAECVRSQGKQAGESTGGGSLDPATTLRSAQDDAVGAQSLSSCAKSQDRVISYLSSASLAVLSLFAATATAQSLPSGGVVTAGQATISQPNGNTLNINQSSQRTVIDWNTFSIGSGNTVQFYQPNSQAAALNIVTGGQASNIQGALLANGQILIQNASGILFGNGSIVNVGSLLATTKSIDANAFMTGSPFTLSGTGTQASIVNNGTITATGYVTLIADQVRNTGNINAGTNVILAAGDSATVALKNGQGINVILTDATAQALVENQGTVQASGAVLLTGRGSDTLLDTVINLSGVVKAGTVVADAGDTGDVVVTGTIDVSSATGQGGTVVFSGNRVGLFGEASINASGDTQGGTVIIGGDSLNKLPGSSAAGLITNVTFADVTQVDPGVTIDAGSAHGDGGFVETSGHSLGVQGSVRAGEWLIDPSDVFIDLSDSPSTYEETPVGTFTPNTTAAAVIGNTVISDSLNGGTNVTITTAGSNGTAAGNITQNTGAHIVTDNIAALTLEADGNITLYGNIEVADGGKLDLTLNADIGNTGTGMAGQASGTIIDLGGGQLNVSGNASAVPGNFYGVLLSGTLSNIGGGEITGAANGSADGVSFFFGSLTQTGGTLNITGASGSGTGVLLNVLNIAAGATANINGTSNSNYGVQFVSTLNIAAGATAQINGTSDSGWGVLLHPGSTVTDNGTLNITGTSNGNGYGVINYGILNVGVSATAQINGTSDSNTGVTLGIGSTMVNNGMLTITGTSTSGRGVWSETTLDIGAGATAQITGTSSNSYGVVLETDNIVTDNGTLIIIGTSDGGWDGVYNNGTLSIAANATAQINGTSNNGYGVYLSYGSNVTDSGKLNITGASNSGYGAYNNGKLNIAAGATANINGTSDADVGVYLDTGSNVTDSGKLNITGASNGSDGVRVNGSIYVAPGVNAQITGDSTSGADYGVYIGNGSPPTLTVDNGATMWLVGNSTEPSGTNGVIHVGAVYSLIGSGRVMTCNNNSGQCPTNSGGSGGGGGGGGGGGAAIGLVVIGAGAAVLLTGEPELMLDAPDALTLARGETDFWNNAELSAMEVNLKAGTAEAKLSTRTGQIKRRLKHTDSADGMNHYTYQNASDRTRSRLSVNPQTREYFYNETGVQGGKSYMVNAHGWLKPSPSASKQAAR